MKIKKLFCLDNFKFYKKNTQFKKSITSLKLQTIIYISIAI